MRPNRNLAFILSILGVVLVIAVVPIVVAVVVSVGVLNVVVGVAAPAWVFYASKIYCRQQRIENLWAKLMGSGTLIDDDLSMGYVGWMSCGEKS